MAGVNFILHTSVKTEDYFEKTNRVSVNVNFKG